MSVPGGPYTKIYIYFAIFKLNVIIKIFSFSDTSEITIYLLISEMRIERNFVKYLDKTTPSFLPCCVID